MHDVIVGVSTRKLRQPVQKAALSITITAGMVMLWGISLEVR